MTDILNRSQSKETIKSKNFMFDNKLKQKGLIDFIRKSNYINGSTEIKLFHIKCRKTFLVKPNYFFKRKYKCPHCYKEELKNKTRSIPKNDFYQNKLNILTNNEFKLLSNYYNPNSYVKLKHITCGHIFETRADNFELAKNKCPKCSNKRGRHNKTISEKTKELEELLDNQYEIVNKTFFLDNKILLKHKSCGEEFECTVSSILKFKNKKRTWIKCPKCDLERRKEEFLDKLDRVQGNEVKLRGAYKGLSVPTKFYHKKCNSIFVVTPGYLIKGKIKDCPECKESFKEKRFIEKLKSTYNDEFELIGKYGTFDKKVTLKHKTCGSSFEIFPSNLFRSSYPCKKCLEKMKTTEKKEKYSIKIKDIYNGKFTFTGDYTGIKTKTEFTCNLCNNTFEETPDNILRGKRKCPYCKQ